MGRFIARRLIMLIPVLIGVSIISFLILHMAPGDPAELLAGEEATKEDIMMVRHELGLDKPLYIQYFMFLKGIFTGELKSLKFSMPVMDVIRPRLFNTLELSLASILIAVVIGIFAGVMSATHRYTWIDYISTIGALLGVSMPVFWWGLILILVFSVNLGLLPSGGMGGIRHLILPAIVLGTASTAIIARMTRSSMLDVLRQDYVRTARAKGLL